PRSPRGTRVRPAFRRRRYRARRARGTRSIGRPRMRFSFFTRSATLALGIAIALMGAASCGRTGLWMADPCDEEGAERNCSDTCGEGVEVCEEGVWSDCSVPKAERGCHTVCGDGTQ